MGTKYSSNSASGYNTTPPSDDGTVSESNKIKWSTIKEKLADPIKTLVDTINSELDTHFDRGPTSLTSNTTLGASHYNKFVQASGSGVTLTLTDASALGAGWFCDIANTDSSNTVSLARATASNTINSTSADVSILPLQALRVFVNAAANGFVATAMRQHSKGERLEASLWMAEGADVASANDCNIWTTDGNTVHVTGTTEIQDWGTAPQAGASKIVIFDGALQLTYNATTNKLNTGGNNYTTVAGDQAIVYAETTTSFLVSILPLTGSWLKSGTSVATTSGTTHDFTIPPWAKMIVVSLSGVSTNGTGTLLVQLGDSGGIENTNYLGSGVRVSNTAVDAGGVLSAGFNISSASAANVIHGSMTITLVDSATNTWSASGVFGYSNSTMVAMTGGSKALSAALTTVRLTSVGPDTFDAGMVNVLFE